jgi:hypothetical protein
MRYLVFFSILLQLCSCNRKKEDRTIELTYDLYKSDTTVTKAALTIVYELKDSFRLASINFDTIHIVFKEKVTLDGIYRAAQSNLLQQTHSFKKDAKVESNIGIVQPMFVNNWATLINSYQVQTQNNDSINVLFFDEVIPFYSFTSSYFLKSENVFLSFYDQRKNIYFKLSSAIGLSNENLAINAANYLTNDTTFFGVHYKLPKVNAPLITK